MDRWVCILIPDQSGSGSHGIQKSIVSAMLDGSFRDYWNQTESYEALKIYVDMNFDGLKDKLTVLMAGGTVEIDPGHFQNDMVSLQTADDVLTLLIHLGYLGYDEPGKSVFIPNHEIQMEFARALEGGEWNDLQETIRQIRDKKYPEALAEYQDDLLLVGISYDRKTRKHECRMERV